MLHDIQESLWKRTCGIVLMASTLLLFGCAGTIRSRDKSGDFFGAVPFQACVTDVNQIVDPDGWVPELDRAAGFFSIPLDLALDTLFAPPDAICWACGMHKKTWQPECFCPR